jgi:beta-ureidopropionase / N-carbamoyl-L-amino-acid hydrolase
MSVLALPSARISAQRLWESLASMAGLGATQQGGCNRQALTDEDRAARDLFVSWARAAGCRVRVDEIGNIFAVRGGQDEAAAPVLIGSHLDTQPTGGRFDGVYGVMAGLEVVRTLNDLGIPTRRSIEVADWTNEEGCRFAPAMLGSGVVAGAYALPFAYDRRDKAGKALGEELSRIGYRGESPARRRAISAAFEVHIEQGPMLEQGGAQIGVVTGIQGACQFDVRLEGVAAHAGTTPMEMRRDPWRVACPLIEMTSVLASQEQPWGRGTVGDIKVSPGARNTIPDRLSFSVDLRHPSATTLDSMVARFRGELDRLCGVHRIKATLEPVWAMAPTEFDATLIALVDECAGALGLSRRHIVSGAGHDSLHVAQFAPTAMIFVPCAGGLSHNEAELASPQDLAAGANVLLQVAAAAANA